MFEAILQNLNSQDYEERNCLIALSFLFTLINNKGVVSKFHDMLSVKLDKQNQLISNYNETLMLKLIGIISKSVEPEFKVRIATLDLAIKLIKSISMMNGKSYISDFHLACIEQVREQSAYVLRQKFKVGKLFSKLNVSYFSNFKY
jgi:hypothetical protein